jgi:hypothetical protein
MITTIAAPRRPRPTVNMPATPPVRNAMRIATFSPDSLAAAATRTFPRTASHMPVKPVSAEKRAPTTKNTERPMATPVEAAGNRKSRNGIAMTNTASVRNCRVR